MLEQTYINKEITLHPYTSYTLEPLQVTVQFETEHEDNWETEMLKDELWVILWKTPPEGISPRFQVELENGTLVDGDGWKPEWVDLEVNLSENWRAYDEPYDTFIASNVSLKSILDDPFNPIHHNLNVTYEWRPRNQINLL